MKGHLALLGANIMWGLMSPITKFTVKNGEVSTLALASFRMMGAMLLFWTLSFFLKKEKVMPGDMKLLFLAALCGIVFNQALYTVGIGFTSPANASIISSTTPIITMVIAAFYLKERITGRKAAGLLASAAGALILIMGSLPSASSATSHSHVGGDLLCLVSQCCVSVYFVFFKGIINRYSPITLMKWMFTYAVICTLPFTWQNVAAIDYAALPSSHYLSIAYVVLFGTFVTYLLLPIGQRRVKPTIVSMYNYIQPVVSSIIAILWGMDIFGVSKVLAVLLIFGGVYIVTQSKSQARKEEERLVKEAQENRE